MSEPPAFMYVAWFGVPSDPNSDSRIEIHTSEEKARKHLGTEVGEVWRFPANGGKLEFIPRQRE